MMWGVPGAAAQHELNKKPSSYSALEDMLHVDGASGGDREQQREDDDDDDDGGGGGGSDAAAFLQRIRRMQQLEQASEKDEGARGWSFEQTPSLVALWTQQGLNESTARPRSASLYTSSTSHAARTRTASAKVRQAKAAAAAANAALVISHRASREGRGGKGQVLASHRAGGAGGGGGARGKHSPTRTTMLRERENSARASKAAASRKARGGSANRKTPQKSGLSPSVCQISSPPPPRPTITTKMATATKQSAVNNAGEDEHASYQPSPVLRKVVVVEGAPLKGGGSVEDGLRRKGTSTTL